MTKEQQRIAIAEWRGWTGVRFVNSPAGLGGPKYMGCLNPGDLRDVPNYPGDLNAMHEAEKKLNAEQQMEYAGIIHKMVHSPRHWAHINFDLIHAAASQRSEALLRTIGKWVE